MPIFKLSKAAGPGRIENLKGFQSAAGNGALPGRSGPFCLPRRSARGIMNAILAGEVFFMRICSDKAPCKV